MLHFSFESAEFNDIKVLLGMENATPTVQHSLPDISTGEDAAWSYTLPADTFADADPGDQLTLSAQLPDGSVLPAWLSFDAASGTFTGTPPDAGALAVQVLATDRAGAQVSTLLNLTITAGTSDPVNHAPSVAQPLQHASATEREPLALTIPEGTFVDQDAGDTLTYSATLADGTPLPSWLAFDAATRTLSGTPDSAAAGALQLRITATDIEGLSANSDFVLSIADANQAPTVQHALPALSTAEDAPWSYTLPADTFADADTGDQLSFSAVLADGTPLSSWLVFDAATRTFSGTPPDAGALVVQVLVTDLAGAQASTPLNLTIAAGSTPPPPPPTHEITGTPGDNTLKGTGQADTIRAGEGNDTLQGLAGDDLLYGEDGGDILRAGDGADQLFGGVGDDSLYGDAGDDTLDGGAGNDAVQGGLGNDIYLFGRGDGQDALKGQSDTAPGKRNTLCFKDGVAASDVQARRYGSALLLSIAGTSDSVRVESFFTQDDPNNASNPLQQVQFADGTMWDLATLVEHALTGNDESETIRGTIGADTIRAGADNDTLQGLAGDDLLYGEDGGDILRAGDGADQLFGGAGDDSLYGDAGDDTLDGGAGNDAVQGGLGNDIYLFGRGDGQDRLTENDATPGNQDVLSFGQGVSAEQLWFRRIGANLEVSIIGSGDTCTISQWYASDARHVEQFMTTDGKVLLDTQVNNLVQAMAAFAPPAAGQTMLAADYQTALAPVMAANWR